MVTDGRGPRVASPVKLVVDDQRLADNGATRALPASAGIRPKGLSAVLDRSVTNRGIGNCATPAIQAS